MTKQEAIDCRDQIFSLPNHFLNGEDLNIFCINIIQDCEMQDENESFGLTLQTASDHFYDSTTLFHVEDVQRIINESREE